MTILFHDIDIKLRFTGNPTNSWSDIEYAGETLLPAVARLQLEAMLHTVQIETTLYGLPDLGVQGSQVSMWGLIGSIF